MEQSPNLFLPYIMPSQAQKHVTHNEAVRRLDALVQLAVLDRDLTLPVAEPAEGDRYIVAEGGTGAWSGRDGDVAAWQDGGWAFLAPRAGWLAWIADEGQLLVFDGAEWTPAAAEAAGASTFGVNATADATNRLAVASPATLLNPEGAGHQLKINKLAPGDTASLLFQTDFSGRAEMGTAGDDDFHFKVSPDGSDWTEALVIDRATGVVRLPQTPQREVLTAPRTYYVRTDGNDGNDGLTDSSSGAFLTIQHAIDAAAALDTSIHDVTIRIGNGTHKYDDSILLKSAIGSGKIWLRGDDANPGNVVIEAPDATTQNQNPTILAWAQSSSFELSGFTLVLNPSATSTGGIFCVASQMVLHDIVMQVGNLSGGNRNCFRCQAQGLMQFTGGIEVSGTTFGRFLQCLNARIQFQSQDLVISGNPLASDGWLIADECAVISFTSVNAVGGSRGREFLVQRNSFINFGTSFGQLGDAPGAAPFGGKTSAFDYTFNHGVRTSGTFTVQPANGPRQRVTNGGAHTLAPPTVSAEIVLYYENNANAGAITTSGWTVVSGAFTATNGHRFECRIFRDGATSVLRIVPLQ